MKNIFFTASFAANYIELKNGIYIPKKEDEIIIYPLNIISLS